MNEQLPPPAPGPLLDLIDELITAVEGAKSVPLSGNVMLDRQDFLGRLYKLRDALPEELRAARWMVRERDAFVAKTNEKARQILDKARGRAEELVTDSHIVREAVEEANTLVRNAESEARRIRLQGEDVAEGRLVDAETVLGELLAEIRNARRALHEARPAPQEPPVST